MTNQNFIDQNLFLQSYWERRVFHEQGLVSQTKIDINKQKLIEMAMDDYYESRLIIESSDDYKMLHGPIENIQALSNDQKWTLFIHNINLYHPEIAALVEQFSFLPLWNFDDVLCSYSMDGASVGAHFDDYNVFIIQLEGKRQWLTQNNPNKTWRDDSDIKVLKHFEADNQIILEPGDMIYIPPHVAHHGISIGESLSLSIGFKSLEFSKLTTSLAHEILETDNLVHKLQPLDQVTPGKDKNHIDQNSIKTISQNLCQYLEENGLIEKLILKTLSTNKFYDEEDDTVTTEVDKNYYRNEHSKLLRSDNYIFIDGVQFKLNPDERTLLMQIFDQTFIEPIDHFFNDLQLSTQSKLLSHRIIFQA